jgi:hypothetical protein
VQKQSHKLGLIACLLLAAGACGGGGADSLGDTQLSDAGAKTPDARADGATAARDASAGGRDATAQVGADDEDADTPVDTHEPGTSDAGNTDCVAFTMPAGLDCSSPDDGPLPKDLRCTGLYGDFDTKKLACGLLEYKPAYQLWSDGAEKRRWASIPAGKKIDVSDPDAFVFPAGTKFFKEFRVKGSNGVERMAETRLLQKSADGWIYTSYVWSEDEKSATQMNNMVGVKDLYGTGHVVPNRDQCNECHGGRKDLILGWDALLLGPGAEGVTRETLVSLGLVDGGAKLDLSIPGNDVERAALGYLHANCGISCHNALPDSKARDSGLYLRLEKGELTSVQTTDAFTSGMNKTPSANAKLDGLPSITGKWVGIRPTDPTRSLLVVRQKLRGVDGQMPRIATNIVDDTGVQLTTDWIKSMTTAAGYPAPAN